MARNSTGVTSRRLRPSSIGFFSDAYCVEGSYGKVLMVRTQAAHVFAEKIEQGQYSLEEAMSIARSLVYESRQTLNGMVPRQE